jgi:hypothetical protein
MSATAAAADPDTQLIATTLQQLADVQQDLGVVRDVVAWFLATYAPIPNRLDHPGDNDGVHDDFPAHDTEPAYVYPATSGDQLSVWAVLRLIHDAELWIRGFDCALKMEDVLAEQLIVLAQPRFRCTASRGVDLGHAIPRPVLRTIADRIPVTLLIVERYRSFAVAACRVRRKHQRGEYDGDVEFKRTKIFLRRLLEKHIWAHFRTVVRPTFQVRQ